jgi:PST family polysaccharide transporter
MVLGLRAAGLPGVAWAHVVTIALVAVPGYLLLGLPATGLRARHLMAVVVRPLVAAGAAALAARAVAHALEVPVLQLLAGGVAGVLAYGLLVAPVALSLLPEHRLPRWVPARWRPAPAPVALQEVGQ